MHPKHKDPLNPRLAMFPKSQSFLAETDEAEPDSDKDLPLRSDIRLLGRLLGDTIRDQEGRTVFDLVEQVRRTSIRFHRDSDKIARRQLEALLDDLSPEQTVQIVRAFSYFSHLANIAEDQHHIRRTRAHKRAGSAPRPGTLSHALRRARDAGIEPAVLRSVFRPGAHKPCIDSPSDGSQAQKHADA